MMLITFMILITSIIIFLILMALKPDSKICDFEIDISVKRFKVKFNTIEKSAPSTKRKH
ncbi:hypothetical protein [Clostridium senegalense]|nr:hypothetical protein [Clostridium senegalense]